MKRIFFSIATLLILAGAVYGAANFMPDPNPHFLNNSTAPCSGCTLYFYDSGTTNPKDTYTDNTMAVKNANPIVLNSRGESANPIWLNGTYSVTLKSSSGSVIWGPKNDISGIIDTAAATEVSQWQNSLSTPTYLSASSFSTTGDLRPVFQPGRRLKATIGAGTVYGTVVTSTFGSNTTTINVQIDTGNLDSGLSEVDVSIITPVNSSVSFFDIAPGTFNNSVYLMSNPAYHGNFNEAVAQIGANHGTLFLDISSNLNGSAAVPYTLSVAGSMNGIITKVSGTIIFSGSLSAGSYQVFSGFSSGDVQFGGGSTEYVYPEWWGAKADGTTASDAAIQLAADSIVKTALTISTSSSKLRLHAGQYNITHCLNFSNRSGLVVEGAGNSQYGSYTELIGNTGSGHAVVDATGHYQFTLRDVFIKENTSTIGIISGFTTVSGSQEQRYERVRIIAFFDDPTVNNGLGTIGYLAINSEDDTHDQVNYLANIAVVYSTTADLSWIAGFSSLPASTFIASSQYSTLFASNSVGHHTFAGSSVLQSYGGFRPAVALFNAYSLDFGNTYINHYTLGTDLTKTYGVAINATSATNLTWLGVAENVSTPIHINSGGALWRANVDISIVGEQSPGTEPLILVDPTARIINSTFNFQMTPLNTSWRRPVFSLVTGSTFTGAGGVTDTDFHVNTPVADILYSLPTPTSLLLSSSVEMNLHTRGGRYIKAPTVLLDDSASTSTVNGTSVINGQLQLNQPANQFSLTMNTAGIAGLYSHTTASSFNAYLFSDSSGTTVSAYGTMQTTGTPNTFALGFSPSAAGSLGSPVISWNTGSAVTVNANLSVLGISRPNSVVNGTFNANTTSWSGGHATLASVAGGIDGNNCLQVTASDGTGANWAQQQLSGLVVGNVYTVTASVKSGTSGADSFDISIFDNALSALLSTATGSTTSSWKTYTESFVATQSNPYIMLRKDSTSNGTTMLFDSVIVY